MSTPAAPQPLAQGQMQAQAQAAAQMQAAAAAAAAGARLGALPAAVQRSEQFEEARAYMERHRIHDAVLQLAAAVLIDRPQNPREFMVRRLEGMRVARARAQNHVLFSRDNLVALFKIFDVTGRGYITIDQYKEGACRPMATLGASKYNPKPLGYGVNRINVDSFADEAMTALRKL
ncbi:hypothetical protein HK105_200087 [Polyrhizophydium stewartii]|uniref:EFCAB10 C-terminal EF-hand domain-containing protein n=1 Tax=Polyrhizophydium stewartii TaxID=2732419 RepID=A0ABR4NKH0_9FUNG